MYTPTKWQHGNVEECSVFSYLQLSSRQLLRFLLFFFSEVLAFSLVSGINKAIARLVDIWDNIGIQEEQRVERMEAVKKHIEVNVLISF